MVRVFFTYWIWHFCMVLMQVIKVVLPEQWMNTLFGMLKEANLAYLSIFTVMALIAPRNYDNGDYKFFVACVASMVTRYTIKIGGIAFGQPIWSVLVIDVLTILAYVLLKKRFDRIDTKNILHVMSDREDNFKL